jgi:lipoprotein NlpI
MRRIVTAIGLTLLAVASAEAQSPLERAAALGRQGKHDEAIQLVSAELKARPGDAAALELRAHLYLEAGQPEKAVTDLSEVIRLNPKAARVIDLRGDAHLRLGKMAEAIADFDRYLELDPRRKPDHWRRGIALYYAGRYKEGVQQFELHQTVNSNDVENAVWHYLCNAKLVGPDKARAALIKVGPDRRVPMTTIFALFAGKAKPEDVLRDAVAGDPPDVFRKQNLFYAHLYLGLYHEAAGAAKASLDHMTKAATDYGQPHYMGDVARVHVLLRKSKP